MAKKKLTLEDMLVSRDEIPYEVPENWCWVKIGNICEVKTGRKDANHATEDGEYPFFTCASKPLKSPTYSFDGECILLAGNGANVGLALYYNGKLEAYQRTYVLKSEHINMKYLLYNLNFRWKDYNEDKQFGSATNYIKLGNITEFEIPLPPLAEQERIVNRIESLFDKVDRAAELVDEARDGFEKRRAAILEMAFSGELTKKWREENGVSDEWKEKLLKDICKVTSGGTPSRKNENYYNGNIPWIKTGEIRWNEIYDSEEHITEEAIANSSAKLIPENTVLVAMYGQGLTRGRAAILRKVSSTNQAVCALIPTDEISCEFLYYYFMKNYWKFREAAKGGNQENLSGKVIGNFSIQIPSQKEQLEIVSILEHLLGKESDIEDTTNIEENIESIKKSILAKAFRGELGSNDLNEESSTELLKQLIK